MSLRTPLGSVLGLGSAKDGTGHFWAQRLSGVALAILGPWFMWCMAATPNYSYAVVVAEIARPINGILLMLLAVTMAYHSYLGIQVVIEDYVHAHGLKLVTLVLSRFAHLLLAAAAIYSILRIGLGA